MSLILNIETATTVCSVSLSDKEKIVAFKETNNGYTHAENLHVFIDAVLKEANVKPNALSAIAVSKGPGSYTGLRIGVSAAKGMAYVLSIPLISVDTLQIMAKAAQKSIPGPMAYCPMLDARRMEVYTAVYDQLLQIRVPVNALIVDEKSLDVFSGFPAICFFGDGMPKCKELLAQQFPNAQFIESVIPSSIHMPELAYQKFTAGNFENVAWFEPYYLKDFLITTKKK